MSELEPASTPAAIETPLTRRLGIRYPIVQGPLGGLPSQRLTALVSNFGGLGSFGALSLEPPALAQVVAEIRALTPRPFAMNLWVSQQDAAAASSGAAEFARGVERLAPLIEELGGRAPTFTPYAVRRFEDQVEVLLDANVPVMSFVFGIPSREIVAACRARHICTMAQATTLAEAIAIEDSGVDIIVASGFEGAGHRGSFLRPAEESLTGTFALVPEIADRVSVPLVAAGGIGDARGLVAALALGAHGVQMGTIFLPAPESGASAYHREAILKAESADTTVTAGFTGRLARGLRNKLCEIVSRDSSTVLPYPLQRNLIKSVTTLAEQQARPELLTLWAGQGVALARSTDAHQILQDLVREAAPIAAQVVRWSVSRGADGCAE